MKRPRVASLVARSYACAWLMLAACAQEAPRLSTSGQAEPLIYGADDRRDLPQVTDPGWRQLMRDAVPALLSEAALTRLDAETFQVTAASLAQVEHTCAGERFDSQPSAAACSGTLVDADLVLTAAHCTGAAHPCEAQIWAFGYALADDGRVEDLPAGEVHRCRSVIALPAQSGQEREELAFVQLDRPVRAHGSARPVPLAALPAQLGEALTVIGYPDGLPIKLDDGAVVIGAHTDHVELTSDTFSGSSGSGVFDSAGRLLASMVRGGVDRRYDPELACSRGRVRDEVSLPAEQASYVGPAIEALCDSGWPSQRLCADAQPPSAATQSHGGCAVLPARASGYGVLAMYAACMCALWMRSSRHHNRFNGAADLQVPGSRAT